MVRKEKSAAAAFVEYAKRVEWCGVELSDGRILEGNAVHNRIRRTGAILNAVERTRDNFTYDDVRAVRKLIDPRLAEAEEA